MTAPGNLRLIGVPDVPDQANYLGPYRFAVAGDTLVDESGSPLTVSGGITIPYDVEPTDGSLAEEETQLWFDATANQVKAKTKKTGGSIVVTTLSNAAAGGGALNIVNVSGGGNYTVTGTEDLLLVDTSVSDTTIDLPAASTKVGEPITIKKTTSDINSIIVDPDGAESIDGQITYSFSAQYESIEIVSDGAGWFVL